MANQGVDSPGLRVIYDPPVYWTRDEPSAGHVAQELALADVLIGLDFRSVLEVGCGFGRITSLIAGLRLASITAIDIGKSQTAAVQRRVPRANVINAAIQDFDTDQHYDLAVAVEVLMHIPPDDLGPVCDKLRRMASWVVTCDWTQPIDGPTAPHNWRHDYARAFGTVERAVPIGKQTIHVIRGSDAAALP